jgi:hypothetical protein
VFSTESSTVVADAGDRRDARARSGESEADGGKGGRRSAFDLPTLDEDKGPNGGGLVN